MTSGVLWLPQGKKLIHKVLLETDTHYLVNLRNVEGVLTTNVHALPIQECQIVEVVL